MNLSFSHAVDVGSSRVNCCAAKGLIFAICVGLLAGTSPVILAQENAQPQSPTLMLNLPPEIASETVQINYFMLGPFGGYGGYVTRNKGRVFYDIPASVDGKPAGAVKIIAYMPGCEIVKLEITIQGAFEQRTLPCRALGRVPLRGRISPVSRPQISGVEVEINYEADWDHEFFCISDGMVTSIQVAAVIPDEDGQFEVELPDFFNQADLGKGSFQFVLRNRSSGNIIAMLKPGNIPRFVGGLAIRSSYDPFVLFSVDPSISTPPSTNSGLVEDRRND
jgi:hypothetical protein